MRRHLHSTMYLLNQGKVKSCGCLARDLHSTMYLLNPKAVEKENVLLDKFTFHYVSIKSDDTVLPSASLYTIYIPLCIY